MATEKISSAQAEAVYQEVPGVLRAQQAEISSLREKVAAQEQELVDYRTNDRIEKIAHAMEEKHIDFGVSHDERVEKIKTAHASGRSLDALEEAVEMTTPNGEFAKIAEQDAGSGANQLEAYLLGDISG